MKKFKRKSFLLIEILFAITLFVLVYSFFVEPPFMLYKSFKLNEKKLDLFLEKKKALHDLMCILEEKKQVKNSEEFRLKKTEKWDRSAQIFFTIDPQDSFSKVEIKFYFKDKAGQTFEESAQVLVKIKK